MGLEIERKFLVTPEALLQGEKVYIAQGYLQSDIDRTVRVRIKGQQGFLTIKGKTQGISRQEFEYEIPVKEAQDILKLCHSHQLEKYRYYVTIGGKLWEVDEFLGDNRGLLLAEIELESEDEQFDRPSWIIEEVSEDKRYFNSYLAQNPFNTWK
ncbi:CYTH domain-containing protein [Cyclobacteriaceae bacterium]|nr:CYTH domain-containing protein [Cyclobacteriaceae bacterium]